jgi:hypothetical protein
MGKPTRDLPERFFLQDSITATFCRGQLSALTQVFATPMPAAAVTEAAWTWLWPVSELPRPERRALRLEQMPTRRLVHKSGGIFRQEEMCLEQVADHLFDLLKVGLAVTV